MIYDVEVFFLSPDPKKKTKSNKRSHFFSQKDLLLFFTKN